MELILSERSSDNANARSEVIPLPRSILAGARIARSYQALENCELCEHRCAVNRMAGERGICHAGPEARVFIAQVEVSDELELIPTFALALSGCDLRCAFCITGQPSWNPRAGEPFSFEGLAHQAETALAEGAKSIMILGGEPTIHLPAVLGLVAALPDEAKLVWKTNAHGSAQARELLDGLFDVWLADYKFGNDRCAQRLAKVSDYTRVVQENLVWANDRSDLIVRHLLMPGHVECCWRPVAHWIADHMPEVKVNLRSGFWPAWHARRHVELRGTVSDRDSERAARIAEEYNLHLIH